MYDTGGKIPFDPGIICIKIKNFPIDESYERREYHEQLSCVE